jgi:glucose/mannose-6-phosphate isomerase
MNLDDSIAMAKLDPQNMIGQIDNLPAQLEGAWQLGQKQPLSDLAGLRTIVVSGMGGSAIGADLLASCVAPQCTLPIIVHRGYDLPAFAQGPETLVIASSHSGNTEETLSSFEKALVNGCRVIAVSTGGKLSEKAQAAGIPWWRFEHAGQPRAAVGFSFGLLLAMVYRLGLIPDPHLDLEKTLQEMKKQQEELKMAIPLARNPAKRLAGQLHERIPIILAADFLEPVARRWKGQVSEIAKSWGQFEFLPEADHNTLAGSVNPKNVIDQDLIVLFLRAAANHPRNQRRIELTRKGLIQAGFTTDQIEGRGDAPMAQMWTALHMGDYTTYYLAMTYGMDPTPVEALESFKAEMKK